jgi:hypothetical protein
MGRGVRLSAYGLVLVMAVGQIPRRPAESWPGTDGPWQAELDRLGREVRALATDLDRVTLLREYTGALIDIGRPDADTALHAASVDFASFDPAAYYRLFRSDRAPAACGITSFFYIRLLEAFGFKAYQYSFGFTDAPYERFVHSVALVEIAVDNAARLVIQDPYLNLTYRTREGEPVDFFEFLSALKTGAYDRIVMDAGSVTTSLLVPDLALYDAQLSPDCRDLLRAALRRDDGTLRTRIPIVRDWATLMQPACDPFETAFVEAMRAHGMSGPFIQAYTRRAADLVGAPDHRELQRRIDSMLR